MTAPRTIDHAVEALFRAMVGRSDALAVATARGELAVLAAAAEDEDFEQRITDAVVNRMAHVCLSATPEEITLAIRRDVQRHVTGSLFLLNLECSGSA